MSRKISIRSRYRPFSHLPGVCALIPHTTWEVKIYPALLLFRNLDPAHTEEHQIVLEVQGPLEGFTVTQDLEKGRIEVMGRDRNGQYLRYFITSSEVRFSSTKRFPLPCIHSSSFPISSERLSLGIHKKQEWEAIMRRLDMAEIFPFWIALAKKIPFVEVKEAKGVLSLMRQTPPPLELVKRFTKIVQVGFEGILSPRLFDTKYQGILPEEGEDLSSQLSSLSMLHRGASIIRSLFFFEEKESWHVLESLPPEFHAGRFVDVQTQEGDLVSIEWSKKRLKKIEITTASSIPSIAAGTRKTQLVTSKGCEIFRIRRRFGEKGKKGCTKEPLFLEPSSKYILDRFSSE